MAGKSLGTLTIDLIAKVGGFVAGMDKAERSSDKWRKKIESDVKAASSAIASMGAVAAGAAVAASSAGIALLKSTSDQITETDRWAKSLKVSTQELLAWQFAAEKAGVSGDQMADIFKDIGDKIGDAVLNKSGEAVDALNALGLSAEKLSKTTPDKQLLAIGDALGKIGTNAEKTTILESLGNDLSKLLPLFDNNNQKLQQFVQLAKDYGVAPNPESINDLIKVNEIFQDMEAQAKGLRIEIASGLAKVDLSPLQGAFKNIHDDLTDPAVLQGLANMVSEVAKLAGWLIRAASATGNILSNLSVHRAARTGDVDYQNINEVDARIKKLEADRDARGSITAGMLNAASGGKYIKDENSELLKLYIARNKLREQIKQQENKPVSQNSWTNKDPLLNFLLRNGEKNGKSSPDAAAKKLENAFRTTEQSYLRQIALIDTTGKKNAEVTEQQKLQFDIADGKLEGLNETQRKRLELLATEVDRLNAVKKANEENLKVAEFIGTLQAQNANAAATLDAEIVGAGMGDEAQARLRARLDIERDYLNQQSDLQKRRQSNEISQSVYDEETAALSDALQQRLAIQEDHYKKLDALQGDWLAGASNGLANWVDSASDYYSQASGLVESSLSGFVDNLSDALAGNKVDWEDWSMSVLQSLQKVLLNAMLVDSIKSLSGSDFMSMFSFGSGTGASGGYTPSGAYSSAAAGVQLNAKGGVYDSADLSRFSNSIVSSPTMFAFAKGAGLMGEAGPEAIMPLKRGSDGSLGVRVAGLDKIAGGGQTGGNQPITQHISVSGNGDAALTEAVREAARQGAQEGRKLARQDMLNDFSNRGQGRRLLGV
ncbi:phage tail tape measure protein [Franconibacter pulveris]|uniref:phage tail tape measure protein n=1 Tax=Franconibacter pulveris TaxID=435910 RepID=UPI0004970316|nr:phage tail tape measure protein [Franconibacter pulveris]